MASSHKFKRSTIKGLLVVAVVILILIGLFYNPKPTYAEVLGTYQGSFLGVAETIELREDGTFGQILILPSGEQMTKDGTWELRHRVVRLSGYLAYYTSSLNKELVIPPQRVSNWLLWHRGKLVYDWDADYYVLRKIDPQSDTAE